MTCPDNLLTGYRRRTLSDREAHELKMHLERCPTCRLALQVGQDFDAALVTLPGDELIAARIAATVLRTESQRPPAPVRRTSSRRIAFIAAAATLLFASGAFAAARLGVLPFFDRPNEVPAPVFPPRAPTPRTPPVAPTPPADPIEEEAAEPVDPAAPEEARAPRPAPAADVLFAEANARRREGDTRRATLLYRQLQRAHPRSSEALVSHVSLGRLLLERSEAAPALTQFDRYLGRAPAGPLAEEALFGKASALARLHRSGEERRTWEALLAAYPRSIYRDRANARLAPTP